MCIRTASALTYTKAQTYMVSAVLSMIAAMCTVAEAVPSALSDFGAWPLTHGIATGRAFSSCGINRTFNVIDFGAQPDNHTDSSIAIANTFAAAKECADSVVLFPAPGIYLSGPILLNGSRHTTLHIENGAELASLGISLARQSKWPIVPELPSYGNPGHTIYAPVLWLLNVHNVVLTGGGTVDGRGTDWWFTTVRFAQKRHACAQNPVSRSCPNPNAELITQATSVNQYDVPRPTLYWL